MSLLGNIAAKALRTPRAMLGADGAADTISINGGASLSCVVGEEDRGREFIGGQQIEVDQNALVELSDFTADYTGTLDSYLGKIAMMAGRSFTVAGFRRREPFLLIRLSGEEEAP